MAVFLLGRELRLLQSFTTDTKLLHAAAQRALSLEATNLQAKDARDDTLSHSSLLEQMAGAEGQSGLPEKRHAWAVTPALCWRCARWNYSDLKESNTRNRWTCA